jgi:hypothetical protein
LNRLPKPPNPNPPEDQPPLDRKNDKVTGDLSTMLKRGASFAAFFGAPAALGAVGSQLGGANLDAVSRLTSQTAAGALGAGYGMLHGAYAGWKAVPGKASGGIMMAIYMVPAGAIGGSVLGTGLAAAGMVGGWPVALGLAGAGFVGGMFHGYNQPDLDKL